MDESDWLIDKHGNRKQQKTMFAFLLLLALVYSSGSPEDYVYGLIDRVTNSVESLPVFHQ